MARTRKRDDDSQCNSETTSLAALDASSMSATGSRSTFASSTKARTGKQRRPSKRRRKSLTDALQSISLEKDKGVPQQILSSKMGGFPFSNTSNNNNKSVAFSTIVESRNRDGSTSPLLFSSLSGVPNHSNLNSKFKANRQIDRESSGAEGDGDIYYDDDNSQLTSSSDDHDDSGVLDSMEDDDDDDDNYELEDDDDSLRKRLALMSDFEKAQRKVMLKLVFGKNHKDSVPRKTENISSFPGPREVSSCIQLPHGLVVDPVQASLSPMSHPPPFSTISTTATATKTKRAAAPNPTPVVPALEGQSDTTEPYKDPADRKIEELLQQSLKNLRDGSHPLQLPNNEENDLFFTTPWKTQDDMSIDPQVYARRIQHKEQSHMTNCHTNTNHSMVLDTETGSNDPIMTKTRNSIPQAQIPPFGRKRGNSLPGGLDMTETTNVAMDMDG